MISLHKMTDYPACTVLAAAAACMTLWTCWRTPIHVYLAFQAAIWLIWEKKGGRLLGKNLQPTATALPFAIFLAHLALGDIWNGEPTNIHSYNEHLQQNTLCQRATSDVCLSLRQLLSL